MKKTAVVLLAIAAFVLALSCRKDDGELINITGSYRYDGNADEVLDAKDFYDFIITENTMKVTGMFDGDVKTFNYTRKKNKIEITPAIGGKVSSAVIVETSGGGFGLKLDETNTLYFSKR